MGSNNNNGGNGIKQELKVVQELMKKPFPEQRGEYRPSFKFKVGEFPLVKVVQFSEHVSGTQLFSDIYHELFPNSSYNDDERNDVSFLDYIEAEWAMYGIFNDPLLIMTSKRFGDKQLKTREPIFAAVVKYERPLLTDDVWRDTVFNNPIKEAGIYSRQELVDKIHGIVENKLEYILNSH